MMKAFHKDKESIRRGSHCSNLGQFEHKIINYRVKYKPLGGKIGIYESILIISRQIREEGETLAYNRI